VPQKVLYYGGTRRLAQLIRASSRELCGTYIQHPTPIRGEALILLHAFVRKRLRFNAHARHRLAVKY
jgi:hypothetical protein